MRLMRILAIWSAVFIVFSSTQCRADDSETIYTFPNGARITTKGGNTYYVPPSAPLLPGTPPSEPKKVADGVQTLRPNALGQTLPNEIAYSLFQENGKPSKLFFALIGQKGVAVNQDGAFQLFEFPHLKKAEIDASGKGFNYVVDTFEHQGRSHVVVSVLEKPDPTFRGKRWIAGRYVVRDDFRFYYKDFGPLSHFKVVHDTVIFDHVFEIGSKDTNVDLSKDLSGEVVKQGDTKPKNVDLEDYGEELLRSKNPIFKSENPEDYAEIRRGLLAKSSGSVVVLGPSGAGKTELAKSFIVDVKQGKYPEIDKDTRIIRIDAASLQADTNFRGTFEKKVQDLVAAAKRKRTIIFVDEIHSLKGSGTHSESSVDFFEMLKTALSDNQIQMIGTSTQMDFDRAFETDPAMLRRFKRVQVSPPRGEKLVAVLKNYVSGHYPTVEVSNENLKYMATLSERFDAVGDQPAKAIRLVDAIIADRVISGETGAVSKQQTHKSASRVYAADPSEFDPSKRNTKLQTLKTEMDHRISGLEGPKDELVRATKRVVTQAARQDRPRLGFHFTGPKGLAKTSLAIAYAQSMGLPHARIEMNKYSNGSALSSEDLMRRIKDELSRNAFTVLIFDEIDKARPDIQLSLLDFLETPEINVFVPRGRAGETVKIKTAGASVIMTSNAGEDYLLTHGPTDFDAADFRQAQQAGGISELVVDRVPNHVPFYPPRTKAEFKNVVKFKLEELIRIHSERHEYPVQVADQEAVIAHVTDSLYRFGATFREATDRIEEALGDALAQHIIESPNATSCPALFVKKHLRISAPKGPKRPPRLPPGDPSLN